MFRLCVVRWAIGVAGFLLCVSGACGEGAVAIRVRVYDYAGLDAKVLNAARAEMAMVFAEAGIAVVSVECPVSEKTAQQQPQCMEPMREGEFAMRMLAESRARRGELAETALGYAFVGEEGSVGVLATALTGRTERLARRAGVDFEWLLGQVMAHELGHLVLGSQFHSETGLMRAGWSVRELRERCAVDWRFQQEEEARMQMAIAAQVIKRETRNVAALKERN